MDKTYLKMEALDNFCANLPLCNAVEQTVLTADLILHLWYSGPLLMYATTWNCAPLVHTLIGVQADPSMTEEFTYAGVSTSAMFKDLIRGSIKGIGVFLEVMRKYNPPRTRPHLIECSNNLEFTLPRILRELEARSATIASQLPTTPEYLSERKGIENLKTLNTDLTTRLEKALQVMKDQADKIADLEAQATELFNNLMDAGVNADNQSGEDGDTLYQSAVVDDPSQREEEGMAAAQEHYWVDGREVLREIKDLVEQMENMQSALIEAIPTSTAQAMRCIGDDENLIHLQPMYSTALFKRLLTDLPAMLGTLPDYVKKFPLIALAEITYEQVGEYGISVYLGKKDLLERSAYVSMQINDYLIDCIMKDGNFTAKGYLLREIQDPGVFAEHVVNDVVRKLGVPTGLGQKLDEIISYIRTDVVRRSSESISQRTYEHAAQNVLVRSSMPTPPSSRSTQPSLPSPSTPTTTPSGGNVISLEEILRIKGLR